MVHLELPYDPQDLSLVALTLQHALFSSREQLRGVDSLSSCERVRWRDIVTAIEDRCCGYPVRSALSAAASQALGFAVPEVKP